MASRDRQRGPEDAPAEEDWIAAQHRLAEKNLSLAAAAATTDDDRSASPLLTAEFNNMQKLSERYLELRKQSAFISLDTFNSTPLEQQILSCAQGFVSMTESHSFQDCCLPLRVVLRPANPTEPPKSVNL